jgi:hypothetical protein
VTVERAYAGTITVRPCGEDDDAFFLDSTPADQNTRPLAELIAEDIEEHGNTVSVAYWITDAPRTLDELVDNESRKFDGAADADYNQHYSEITGYLWTDAELKIGGHDLLAELGSHEGSWCCLSIRFQGTRRDH